MNGELIVGLLLFIVIIVFISIVCLSYMGSKTGVTPTTEVALNNGSEFNICFNDKCDGNLLCDSLTGICKNPIGATCNSAQDCAYPAYCSGVCVTGDNGEVNQNCPCNAGLVCTNINGIKSCKLEAGQTCTNNTDCASISCVNTICQTGLPTGYPCTNNTQCLSSNICSNGFCQTPGFPTGTIGSRCTQGCMNNVNGASCGDTQVCKCDQGQGLPGICVGANSGIFGRCDNNTFCSSFMGCYNSDTGADCSGDNCLCYTPYKDPNMITSSQRCITGMKELLSNPDQCFNDVGLGCDSANQCAGICTGSSSIVKVNFTKGTSITPVGSDFINSTNMSINRLPTTSLLSATNSNISLFGTSIGTIDHIYAGGNGLVWITSPISGNGNSTRLIPPSYTVGNRAVTYITGDIYTIVSNIITLILAFYETGPDGNFYTLYTCPGQSPVELTYSQLTPYNVTAGPGYPGTQRSASGVLAIDNITYNAGNVIITSLGSGYLKKVTETIYSIPNIVGGDYNNLPLINVKNKIQFYNDILRGTIDPISCPELVVGGKVLCPNDVNYAFVKNITPLIKFSGSMSPYTGPTDPFNNNTYAVYDYSISSNVPGGILSGSSIALANVTSGTQPIGNMAIVVYNGSSLQIPYRVGESFKSLATANSYYIFSAASCL